MKLSENEAQEQPDNPWWVGHPLVKYPALSVIGIGIWARFSLEGDSQALVLALALLVICVASIFSAAMILRGTIQPLSWFRFERLSPIALAVVGVAFIIVSLLIIVDVLIAPEERWTPIVVGAWTAVGVFFVGVIIQCLSWSETWPDKWHPPYARRSATSGSPDDEQSTVGPPETES